MFYLSVRKLSRLLEKEKSPLSKITEPVLASRVTPSRAQSPVPILSWMSVAAVRLPPEPEVMSWLPEVRVIAPVVLEIASV